MSPKREDDVALEVPRACTACGVVLERRDRDHCDDCLPEELRKSAMAFRQAGRVTLAALRAQGEDPARSDMANRRRGEEVAKAHQAFREWATAHGDVADPGVFRREILPGLEGVSLGVMAKATGLSESYCSFIRRGIKVPHRRHWNALVELIARA